MNVKQISITKARGLNLARRLLLSTITYQTGILTQHDANKYFDLVDRLIRTRGARDSVIRLKQMHHVVLNFMLDQPMPIYPIRVDKGLPYSLKYLRRYKSSPEGIQAALSLTNYYRSIVAPGKPDFSPITDESTVSSDEIMTQILKTDVPREWDICVNDLPSVNHLYKVKKGPNGLATYSAFLDLEALTRTDNLLQDVRYFVKEQNDGIEKEEMPQEILDFYRDNPDLAPPPTDEPIMAQTLDLSLPLLQQNENNKHSRLAIKREGGGKDRVFAIADYFTQCSLDPLHHKLARILSKIRNDCTFNQGKGVEDIKEWTKSSTNLWSLDLSSATDRFPRELQRRLLQKLTDNNEFGNRWADLMANREFHYRGKTYKWSVGQPLGALSSWPMFALTHHYVVRYCLQQPGVNGDYYLLGDDIVMKGDSLANVYKETMRLLGVSISLAKSVNGKSAEFAKRIFTRGVEVSPAPVQMISSLIKDQSLIKATVDHLTSRSCQEKPQSNRLVCFLEEYSLIKGCSKENVFNLGFSPVPLGAGNELTTICSIADGGKSMWGHITHLNLEQVQMIYISVAYKELQIQIKSMQKKTDEEYRLLTHMEIPGLKPGTTNYHESFPMQQALDERGSQLLKAMGKVVKLMNEQKFIPGSVVEVQVPNLNILSFELKPKSKRLVKIEKLIISKTLVACQSINCLIEQKALDPLDNVEIYNIVIESTFPAKYV
jgi:hypothetical protein